MWRSKRSRLLDACFRVVSTGLHRLPHAVVVCKAAALFVIQSLFSYVILACVGVCRLLIDNVAVGVLAVPAEPFRIARLAAISVILVVDTVQILSKVAVVIAHPTHRLSFRVTGKRLYGRSRSRHRLWWSFCHPRQGRG